MKFQGCSRRFQGVPEAIQGCSRGVKFVLWGLRTFRGFPTGGRNVPSVFKGFQGCSERFKVWCFRRFQATRRGVPRGFRNVPAGFRGVPDVFMGFQGCN